jgi:hypothetical protein
VKKTEQSGEVVPVDPVVRQFNALNATIGGMVPAVAIAQDTLERVVPHVREMQKLLSKRPCGAGRATQ